MNVWRHKTTSPVPTYLPACLKCVLTKLSTGQWRWRLMDDTTMLSQGLCWTKKEAHLAVQDAKIGAAGGFLKPWNDRVKAVYSK